tara:strand:- start:1553 stop:1735 length:183 start_codon:yes stop_codon:yes gene_type:complete
MGGLNYIFIKKMLMKHKLNHYKIYKETSHHHEKSYHFGAWRAIQKLEKDIDDEIKKNAEL